MPLTQLLDKLGEPLDLWLSPNHEARPRDVHPSEILSGDGASDGAGKVVPTVGVATAPGVDTHDVVLCEFVQRDDTNIVPDWLKPTTTETSNTKSKSPISANAVVQGRSSPSSKSNNAFATDTYDPIFATEVGVPCVFVTKPERDVMCGTCGDVFVNPVVSNADGGTRCRACAPSDEEKDASEKKNQLAKDDRSPLKDHLAEDYGALERVSSLKVMCRHGLRYVDNADEADGVGRWTHEAGVGCSFSVAIGDRKSHEDRCGFSKLVCNLPYLQKNAGDPDACQEQILRRDLPNHRAVCQYRLVPCSIPGCGERKRANRLAAHVAICDKKTVKCPNGCPWRGRGGELPRHRAQCELWIVACGRTDAEGHDTCTHKGPRSAQPEHDQACPFRVETCEHCERLVCARRLVAHLASCDQRKAICESCGELLLVTKLKSHTKSECAKNARAEKNACAFARFGCSFSGCRDAMEKHEAQSAPDHLRMVSLAVEASSVSYDAWYKDVSSVRDELVRIVTATTKSVQAVSLETKRVVDCQMIETEKMQTAFADLRAHYEFQLGKVKETHRIRALASEKRLNAVVTENELLRTQLSLKMSKERGAAIETGVFAKIAQVKHFVEAAVSTETASNEKHARRWETDVTRILESVVDAKAWVDKSTLDLHTRIAKHEVDDDNRRERCDEELAEFNCETINDLAELSKRQQNLEKRWMETNAKLRDPTQHGSRDEIVRNLPSQIRWEATRAADAMDSVEKKVHLVKQAPRANRRGAQAAELLFGKGSRADPHLRSGNIG